MSVRPSKELSTVPQLDGQLGWETPPPVVVPPVDRVPDATVETPLPIESPDVALLAEGSDGLGDTDPITIGAATTAGTVLLLAVYKRNGDAACSVSTPGWSLLEENVGGGSFDDTMAVFGKVADGTETEVTVSVPPGSASAVWQFIEVEGASLPPEDTATASGSGTGLVSGSATVTAASVIIGAWTQVDGDAVYTQSGAWSIIDAITPISSHPSGVSVWQEVAAGTYTPGVTSDASGDYRGVTVAIPAQTSSNWELAPEVTDSDNATYHEVAGASSEGHLLRVELEDAYIIASAVLRIGFSAGGATTLDLYGATLGDFSDEVLLASSSFMADGSYTADVVTFDLPATTEYQYYRIAGTGACRIYALEMYETSLAGEVSDHISDPVDAHDASAISVADTADNFTGTDVEAVLAELASGGGPDVALETVADAGATETIDVSTARTYDVTLSEDVTITLAGAVNAEAWFVAVFLRQDGTGGWDVTWPGSVEWMGGTAPTIDPAANAVTVVTLGSLDGGTTWYGFPTGGGTGTGLDVELVEVADAGATETVDVSVARTYDLGLTEDCALTLTGATDGEAWYLTLLLRQGGAGGWDITWPGSVTWTSGSAPTLSTAPGDVDVVTLFTVDGGTQWIGVTGVGSGGPSVAALDDLTDVNAAAPADQDVLTWDDGAGEWIPQAQATASAVSALGFVGQILISDTPSTPLVFADLIQNEAQTDLVYADL